MSEANKAGNDAEPNTLDWGGIAAGAELKVNHAIEQLCMLLITRKRLELLSRVATYILFSQGRKGGAKDHAQSSEVNLEYLCSLATALPDSPADDLPSGEDVQATIDLLATIHTQGTVAYTAYIKSSEPEGEALSELSKAFQLQKLHVRGDGYEHHLKQTWHDMMTPHNEVFQKTLGFAFPDYFNFAQRQERVIEDRINQEADQKHPPYRKLLKPWVAEMQSGQPWSNECQNFLREHHDQIMAAKAISETFGSPESFLVDPTSAQEQSILKSLSCGFGDNKTFCGEKERFRCWPLNETIMDKKPFIQHQGKFYALNLFKIGRNGCEIVSHALRDSNPKYWHSRFLPGRDQYLEDETVRLFQKALPTAHVLAAGFYPLRTGGRAEADIVIVLDDVLVVVECKAGTITPSAKRGGPMRVKTDVKKTIAEGLNQAERLVDELVASGELVIQNKGSEKMTLKAEDFRWVFRVNVTLDLISPVASSIWSLSDIGLVGKTERCWSVSLNDLRVVVEILDQPAVFLHYLIRRFDTDQLRNVEASDELDYMMHYVIQGLFFRGKNKPRENEHLKIVAYTDDLDQYYRRRQGLTEKGAKPRVRLGPHTERFLGLLEKWRPKGWMTASLQFLEFDPPDREKLLGKIHLQFKRVLRQKCPFALSVINCADTRTAIGLACAPNPVWTKDAVRARCIDRCKDYGIDAMVVILVGIPVTAHAPCVLCVTPSDTIPDHAKHLLAQLRFEVTEHRPKTSRPGIFDGIRENVE